MASNRHSNQTAARCKAPAQIDWHCQHCHRPAGPDGSLAITRRSIRQLTAGRTQHAHWRIWCRPCARTTHDTMSAFRRAHDHIPLAAIPTQAHIDAETIRRATRWQATWMARTNWAHITSTGGHHKETAAA